LRQIAIPLLITLIGVRFTLEAPPKFEWAPGANAEAYEVFACSEEVCHFYGKVTEPKVQLNAMGWRGRLLSLGVTRAWLKVRSVRGDEVSRMSDRTHEAWGFE
jgi:hypothetical protein